jgi:hypothetical protein
MLRIIERFGKHCSCYLQGECVELLVFWKPYIETAVVGDLDFMVLIGGVEERRAAPQIQLTTYCLPCIRLPKKLQPLPVIFTESLDNS